MNKDSRIKRLIGLSKKKQLIVGRSIADELISNAWEVYSHDKECPNLKCGKPSRRSSPDCYCKDCGEKLVEAKEAHEEVHKFLYEVFVAGIQAIIEEKQ